MGTHGVTDRDEPGLGTQQHGEAGANRRLRVDDHDSRHGQYFKASPLNWH